LVYKGWTARNSPLLVASHVALPLVSFLSVLLLISSSSIAPHSHTTQNTHTKTKERKKKKTKKGIKRPKKFSNKDTR
jgi:hypothetical protein